MELFTSTANNEAPLAFRMRPRNIDEFIGQDHIAGPGRLLRRIIQADRMSSIIFYGPPGTGKTTLARVIANTTSSSFITLNAVLDGVKNLRDAIAEAQSHRDLYDRRTILFIDEVHRWNKSQQDALLPWVENGTVILIGATTENPYFEVNKALVSRSRIFQLKPLTEKNLHDIAIQAVNDPSRGYGRFDVSFSEDSLGHLVKTANGDARSLLNAVELAVQTSVESFPPEPGSSINVDMEAAEESIQKKALLYDKEGDYHYDTISAFIKSIRGSDPDATLYWLATMIRAGEEPRYMFRRMLISASEDIGLADPAALGMVESAAAAFDRVGLPEGRFHLAQAALYLATAPKSNTTLALFDALGAVEKEFAKEVPNHLRDPGRDKEGFGHGAGYMYPHAYKDHWVAQQYLPAGLQGRVFYEPSDQGFEAGIKERITRQRELQLAAVIEEKTDEILTFARPDKTSERWLNRINRETSGTLAAVREGIFANLKIARHECILVMESAASVLLWEAVRKTPEGSVYHLPAGRKAAEISRHWAASLPEETRPIELSFDETISSAESMIEGRLPGLLPSGLKFEKIIMRDLLTKCGLREEFFAKASELLTQNGSIHLYQMIPSMAQRLSNLDELLFLKERHPELHSALSSCEELIYHDQNNKLVNWGADEIKKAAAGAGFSVRANLQIIAENRPVQAKDLESWFNPEGAGYGRKLSEVLSTEDFEKMRSLIYENLKGKIVKWKQNFLEISADKNFT
ncbi:MAG: AAA family ATPase [Spirochaetales bacterium]|nr:AAA family ATPase [Spirochaetales bacterium]